MPKDPVCGMEVEKKGAVKVTRNGKNYYFCSEADRNAFKENPTLYM